MNKVPVNIQRFSVVFTSAKAYRYKEINSNKKTKGSNKKKFQLLEDTWGFHGLWPRPKKSMLPLQGDSIRETDPSIQQFQNSWKPLDSKTNYKFMTYEWSTHGRHQAKVNYNDYFELGHNMATRLKSFKDDIARAYSNIDETLKGTKTIGDVKWRCAPAFALSMELEKILGYHPELKASMICGNLHLFEVLVDVDYNTTIKNYEVLKKGAKFTNCADNDILYF